MEVFEEIMLKLGFHRWWVNIIMSCVTSVKYAISFHLLQTEVFTPTRGLRQGDPLSPYLFLMVAGGLSSMLKGVEERGDLVGVKVYRGASAVSHLLFVDDSLILMQTDKKNVDNLKEILD